MSTTIAIINSGVTIVEITMIIMVVNAKIPSAGSPINRTNEIVCCYH
jgi:hypothetical protein